MHDMTMCPGSGSCQGCHVPDGTPTPVKLLDYFFLLLYLQGLPPAQDVRQAAACLTPPGPGGAPLGG
jgi:hypothetical protein